MFVIALWSRTPLAGGIVRREDVLRLTINGKSWPYTEPLSYALGDTVHFRVINTSAIPHPMHLHGFYFSVDSRGDGTVDSVYDRASPPYRVVTERMAPYRTMSMTWVPERAGNKSQRAGRLRAVPIASGARCALCSRTRRSGSA